MIIYWKNLILDVRAKLLTNMHESLNHEELIEESNTKNDPRSKQSRPNKL